jgi:hypothetical protein
MTVARTVEHAVATDVCADDDASLVSDVRSFRLGVPGSCAKVRAGIVQAGALTGAGSAHCIASVGRRVCCRLSSWQDTAVQRPCGDGVYTRCEVSVFKCRIVANCSHGVVQIGETHSRFKLCARTAPSGAHWCARMRVKDTRLSIPAAGKMCSTFADLSITAASWLEREFVTL